MTIVIAMACSDGVLMASDSMGSSGRYATRVQKLQTRDRLDVVWANSGTEFLGQTLDNAVRAVDLDSNCTPLAIAKSVDPILRTAVGTPIAHDGDDHHRLESLLVAWVDGAPSIVHIPADLATVECRHKEFVAIGSAHEYAHVVKATLEHHFAGPLTIQRASLLAFRIIAVVCAASSWGVAPPVQIAVVDKHGARTFGASDLDEIETGVERWIAVEGEQLAGGEQAAVPSVMPAMPADAPLEQSAGA